MASELNNFVKDKFLQCLYILDAEYHTKFVVDIFSDFLWVERYCGYGEFEITMPVSLEIIKNCRLKDYVSIRESDKIMIIETIEIHTDPENGDILKISGRSLESLLERRIVLEDIIGSKTDISDDEGEIIEQTLDDISVQEAIKIMINNSVISPKNKKRQIENFTFKEATDKSITELVMSSFEEQGANLYDKILSICQDKELGFRVTAVKDGGFEFELYRGTDRSWNQEETLPVVFSESYENLSNSNYLQTERDYKSTVYVKWNWQFQYESQSTDEEGNTQTNTNTETGSEMIEVYRTEERIGLDRRESFMTDGTTYTIEAATQESIDSVEKQVIDKAKEYLSDYKVTKLFEGDAEPYRQFIYGVNYILGDIVQLENKYGESGICRITEITLSKDATGPSMLPTFEGIEEDGEGDDK